MGGEDGAHAAPTVRTLTDPDEVDAGLAVFRTAMVGMRPRPPHPGGDVFALVERGRMHGGYLGGELVGAADSTTGELTVPGGARVPHAAVTRVGVLPTHTRRGVLSALMRAQLTTERERGVVAATLRASEGTIYGRFGYAVASELRSLRIAMKDAVLRPEVAAAVDRDAVRLVDAEDQDVQKRIVEAVPGLRPGTITRGGQWWNNRRLWAEATPGPRYLAVHGAPGAEDGYVRYRPADTAGWFTSPERTVIVEELYAPSPAARRDLLAFLLGLDLVDVLELPDRPVDDVLGHLLTDPRAARTTGTADETWLRLLDVPAALAARSYAGAPGDAVTLAVDDPLLPGNTGAHRITAGGAAPAPAGAPADVHVDVEALAAAYLGGTPWRVLAEAGLLGGAAPDGPPADATVAALDRLFAVPEAPFAGVMF